MLATISVSGTNYTKCCKASENYWANSKPGFFGRGIINTKEDPFKVTRIGLLGEMAFAIYMGLDLDFDYVAGGEKVDLVLPSGLTVDVKTASRNYGAALIRCKSAKGRRVLTLPKMCDVYVGGYLEEDGVEDEAKVTLCGWLSKDEVFNLPDTPARVGLHMNKELVWGGLRPMEELCRQ